ncbi:hypothetical protein CTAYLR_002953 [Chrysophaeum taylorii]|uniref:Methyltransferase type 11 domain-containing protein n=1 Tax=Chrysophaeum taylorii TaxID=2483200 RepID=A0AAD7XGG9_9STRA|nr:hypothetical protein CTAYLR_002953 [Chrysophaeum taylorii]
MLLFFVVGVSVRLRPLASIFGEREYWQDMYEGRGDFPSDEYSWYLGWRELAPIWEEMSPGRSVVVPGAGNDPCVAELHDAGYEVTAFDYAPAAIERLRELLGDRSVRLEVADARSLPDMGPFDAALDKGFADAVHLGGALKEAVDQLHRVLRPGASYLCVTTVVPPDLLDSAFSTTKWRKHRDGAADIGPGLYIFTRT